MPSKPHAFTFRSASQRAMVPMAGWAGSVPLAWQPRSRLGGVHMIPKSHLWIHICLEAQATGFLRYTWTFADELRNGRIARAARFTNPRRFSMDIFRKELAVG